MDSAKSGDADGERSSPSKPSAGVRKRRLAHRRQYNNTVIDPKQQQQQQEGLKTRNDANNTTISTSSRRDSARSRIRANTIEQTGPIYAPSHWTQFEAEDKCIGSERERLSHLQRKQQSHPSERGHTRKLPPPLPPRGSSGNASKVDASCAATASTTHAKANTFANYSSSSLDSCSLLCDHELAQRQRRQQRDAADEASLATQLAVLARNGQDIGQLGNLSRCGPLQQQQQQHRPDDPKSHRSAQAHSDSANFVGQRGDNCNLQRTDPATCEPAVSQRLKQQELAQKQQQRLSGSQQSFASHMFRCDPASIDYVQAKAELLHSTTGDSVSISASQTVRTDPRLFEDDVDIKFSRALNSCKLPQIRYASKERLFERLTDLRFMSVDFLNTFLLTYRVFTSAEEIIDALKSVHYNCDRYVHQHAHHVARRQLNSHNGTMHNSSHDNQQFAGEPPSSARSSISDAPASSAHSLSSPKTVSASGSRFASMTDVGAGARKASSASSASSGARKSSSTATFSRPVVPPRTACTSAIAAAVAAAAAASAAAAAATATASSSSENHCTDAIVSNYLDANGLAAPSAAQQKRRSTISVVTSPVPLQLINQARHRQQQQQQSRAAPPLPPPAARPPACAPRPANACGAAMTATKPPLPPPPPPPPKPIRSSSVSTQKQVTSCEAKTRTQQRPQIVLRVPSGRQARASSLCNVADAKLLIVSTNRCHNTSESPSASDVSPKAGARNDHASVTWQVTLAPAITSPQHCTPCAPPTTPTCPSLLCDASSTGSAVSSELVQQRQQQQLLLRRRRRRAASVSKPIDVLATGSRRTSYAGVLVDGKLKLDSSASSHVSTSSSPSTSTSSSSSRLVQRTKSISASQSGSSLIHSSSSDEDVIAAAAAAAVDTAAAAAPASSPNQNHDLNDADMLGARTLLAKEIDLTQSRTQLDCDTSADEERVSSSSDNYLANCSASDNTADFLHDERNRVSGSSRSLLFESGETLNNSSSNAVSAIAVAAAATMGVTATFGSAFGALERRLADAASSHKHDQQQKQQQQQQRHDRSKQDAKERQLAKQQFYSPYNANIAMQARHSVSVAANENIQAIVDGSEYHRQQQAMKSRKQASDLAAVVATPLRRRPLASKLNDNLLIKTCTSATVYCKSEQNVSQERDSASALDLTSVGVRVASASVSAEHIERLSAPRSSFQQMSSSTMMVASASGTVSDVDQSLGLLSPMITRPPMSARRASAAPTTMHSTSRGRQIAHETQFVYSESSSGGVNDRGRSCTSSVAKLDEKTSVRQQQQQHHKHQVNIRSVVTIRVLSILRHWVSKHAQDFVNDPKLCYLVQEFLHELVADKSLLAAEHRAAVQLQNMLRKTILMRDAQLDLGLLLSGPTRASQDSIETLSALEIAEGMTYLDHKIFQAIRSEEFLGQAWMKIDKAVRAPHILLITKRFNDVSRLVASEIIRVPELHRRVAIIEKWTNVAHICRVVHNFNGVLQICAAFTNSAIFRLKKTWDKMPKTTKTTIDQLQNLVSTDSRFKNMRDAINRCDPPSIPYVGMYLTDLSFIEEGTPNHSPDGLLNFSKMRMVAHVIREIQHLQAGSYKIELNHRVANYLLDSSRHLADDEMYKCSLAIEPKSTSSSSTTSHAKNGSGAGNHSITSTSSHHELSVGQLSLSSASNNR